MGSSRRRRKRAEPTDDREPLLPLFEWTEQERYEAIRPLVLFGDPVGDRAVVSWRPDHSKHLGPERGRR